MNVLLLMLASGWLLGADAPADDAVKEVEKVQAALNEAFKTRNLDVIKSMLTEDHVAVTPYYPVPMERAEQLKNLADFKAGEYTAGKTRVTLLSKDVAQITYPMSLKATFKGKEFSYKGFVSALWVRRDGKWVETFYQETPLESK
jgi:ketosteroid isomerase-like protein